MAASSGKSKLKKKSRLKEVLRLMRICLLCGAVAGVLFAAGYGLDHYKRRGTVADTPASLLPPDEKLPPVATRRAAPEQEPQQQQLSFFETLMQKSPEEDAIDADRRKKLLEIQRKPRSQPPKPKKIAQKPPAAKAVKSAKPLHGKFTIQVGSFSSARSARQFSEELAEKGYEPYIVKIHVAGKGTVYRVRMGRFNSMEEAQPLAKKFEKNEKRSVLITSR